MSRPTFIALAFSVLCLVPQPSSRVAKMTGFKTTRESLRDTNALQSASIDSIHAARYANLNPLKALSRIQGRGICRPEQIDLTGSYNAVFFINKSQKEGKPARITVEGNNFRFSSEDIKGSGLVSGFNNCGEASVALKFTEATGPSDMPWRPLLDQGISLDARIVGGRDWHSKVQDITSENAVVLTTARDKHGNFAGPDVAFVICPEYPKCKKYPTCPCVEPPPQPKQ